MKVIVIILQRYSENKRNTAGKLLGTFLDNRSSQLMSVTTACWNKAFTHSRTGLYIYIFLPINS